MTPNEYEQKRYECWEEFCRHIVDEEEEFYNMFDRAYALGKQEKDADTEIQGWVAKDNDSQGLYLYSSMPTREIDMWNGHGTLLTPLDSNSFPDLTWESEPIEVELIIKRKNNG